MSFEWTSQPLSIKSIASQHKLPVVIRSAPGFRGSSRPLILHSVLRIKFVFGRALRVNQSKNNQYESFTPIDSELVAVPWKFSGYFQCLPSHTITQSTGVIPETSILPIAERIKTDQRPVAYYVAAPMRAYTLENNDDGSMSRVWIQIEAYQRILFDKIIDVEFTPTEDDQINDEDYTYSWWFCYGKQLLNRSESVLQCILPQQQICYIPTSLPDEVNLIPVGQKGSSNVNKLQNIPNLGDQFSMPVNVKLIQLPGAYAYQDFNGRIQLLGTRSEEVAVCASLTTSNIAVIPIHTPLKFVFSSVSSISSSQLSDILSSCHMFARSFDMQIRRILVSSQHDSLNYRARSRYAKTHSSRDDHKKRFNRSQSVNPNGSHREEHTTTTVATTDEDYRSGSSAAQMKANFGKSRSTSIDVDVSQSKSTRKRASSVDDDSGYHSLVHAVRAKQSSSSNSTNPPPLPEKPPNFPFPHRAFTYDSGSNLIENVDLPNANGAILIDSSHELILSLPSDTRFT